MDKPRVLESVAALAAAGNLCEEEFAAACREGAGSEAVNRSNRYSAALIFVGAGVVFLGVAALISQYWNEMGSAMRMVVAPGTGIAAFAAGVLFSRRERFGAAGSACFLVAAAMLPSGFVAFLNEAGFHPGELGLQSLISIVMMGAFATAYLLFRWNSLVLSTTAFATWAFFAVTTWIGGSNPGCSSSEFFAYRTIIAGLSYVVLAFAFSDTPRRALSEFLYGLGAVAVLGSALALGGWGSNRNVVWGVIFVVLVMAALGASLRLGSKALLTIGSLFFAFFLTRVTTEVFSGSVGWPTILVVFGVSLMGFGYLIFERKRRYLNERMKTGGPHEHRYPG
jgi:hypothetical protein